MAGVLGVLAIVVLTVTAIAVWAGTTLFDSEKVAEIAGDALAEPEVQAAMATYLTDQVFAAVDVQSVLDDVLPTNLQRLEPVLAAGARSAVDRGLTRVLANPEVQDVLTTVVERSHRRAMRLLQGDGLMDGVDVTDGVVTLNTLPLIGRGVEQLQELGLFTNLQLPELSADGDPDRADRRPLGGDGSGPPRRLRAARRVPQRRPGRRPGVAADRAAAVRRGQAGRVAAHRV